jgi:hypothetical protein
VKWFTGQHPNATFRDGHHKRPATREEAMAKFRENRMKAKPGG